ncbi:MAG TPA: RNA methyltransferase [Ferruginibacter sp.]|nr:RNA methyltransferase [Ferruginibacter sp.]
MISKPHTKYIQSLQQKKFRDEYGCFVAEGPKLVSELLAGGRFTCREIIALPGWIEANPALIALPGSVTVTEVQEHELEKISGLSTPNEVLAVFEKGKQDASIDPRHSITLVLDTIQDPGNMGTIIRIADWYGVTNIVCATGSADIYNPKVVQATMGSLGRVLVLYTDIVSWLRQQPDIRSFAATLDGKPVGTIGKLSEAILVIGNETHGIRNEVLAHTRERITIPRIGEAESLNAAVATGIILSHMV